MTNLLHEKVLKSDADGVRQAISSGIDLNELDDLGESPLHWAVLRGDDDIVLLLLENGANPNVICSGGYSPKWGAEDFGLTDIINILTTFGGKTLTDHNFDRTHGPFSKVQLGKTFLKRIMGNY